ncbi:LOW QUALITY PROTEIN: hypothetical protein U9M48_043674 [Paspalum notatum var. saurae]|uniref:Reverse transcriptase Ty1/copia-type domain-containing protein n=1 Tax=Paspalum notatum var. saurae TaxID=547442 RepID=A0AAQ3UTG1_PASNO
MAREDSTASHRAGGPALRGMSRRKATTHGVPGPGAVAGGARMELVHGDLCGPVSPATPTTPFLLLVDDRSRYMWLVLLPSTSSSCHQRVPGARGKDPAASCWRSGRIGAASSHPRSSWKTARRTACTGKNSPQQNGVVDKTRWWLAPRAVCSRRRGCRLGFSHVYLLTECRRTVEGKTPFEAWLHHLKTFCIVYVKNTIEEDGGSHKMIFVGGTGLSGTSTGADHGGEDTFTVQYRVVPGQEDTVDAAPATPDGGLEPGTPPATPSMAGPYSPLIQFATPPAEVDEELDADHDEEAPLRFRMMENVIGAAAPPGYAVREPTLHLPPGRLPRPSRIHARRAMEEELRAIEENHTWTLTELPLGRRAIGLKWVFKVKRDEHGAVVRHKARLVVKGYAQRHGVDYDEVFAPVARIEAVRLLLALAAQEGWEVHHMDVKTAFLNGDLQEEVYVQQAPGFAQPGQEHKVYKLHKALYGLHQAPRAWNQKLDEQLGVLGFVKCPSEHAIYCRGGGVERLVVGVYVDDLVITGTSSNSIQKFKAEMTKVFKMSDLGLLSYYLGIEVKQRKQMESVCLRGAMQRKYWRKMDWRIAILAGLKLSKESNSPRVNATDYRSLVGSLRYLVNTRPDLAFSVGYVSRFMEEPHEEHLAAVKQILRYIAGTRNWGLFYARRNGGSDQLLGYSDSDMAGDLDGRKSTSGILFFLGRSPISWQSAKQKVVALSSCEAEYIAAATAACQAVWLARVLAEIKNSGTSRPLLRVDNKSTISLVKNPVHHDRSKHIDVRFHLIREYANSGQIEVKFIRTDDQLGDILTKPLGKDKFHELCSKIGLGKLQ